MNALIILAHPENTSYNAALARQAQSALQGAGHQVRLIDLYEQGFEADEHARHFRLRADPSRFDPLTEQRFSADQQALPADVQNALTDLRWADLLVLQFPLWWFGMPAILKGWMDRVFVYGEVYSSQRRFHTGAFNGKRALLSVTAGSSQAACAPDGREGDTSLILWPVHYTLHYVGFTVLEPVIITDVRGGKTGADEEQQRHVLQQCLHDQHATYEHIEARSRIAFNQPE